MEFARALSIFSILVFCGLVTAPSFATKPSCDWTFVEKKLAQNGLRPAFIKALKKNYQSDHFAQILELNTLLFLKKSDYHGIQVNDDAVRDVRGFIAAHEKSLTQAEKKFSVPGPVVASLLWLESRHGRSLGTFHVPSVFVDLTQTDRPPVVHYLNSAARRFTKHVSLKDRLGIASRAKKRVKWAMAELKAIQKMYDRDKKNLREFRGSFAGAFGMPQFEPSSYIQYARAQRKGHSPNLYKAEDAIQSVAFYLQQSGWRPEKQTSFVTALMKYNNSHDYAQAILNLAKQAAAKTERVPASRKRKSRK